MDRSGSDEAHFQDYHLAGDNLCPVDWSPGDVLSSTHSHLVGEELLHSVPVVFSSIVRTLYVSDDDYLFAVAYLFCGFIRMLWFANGWSRSNALSNLSSRSSTVAAGTLCSFFCTLYLIWTAELKRVHLFSEE